MTRFHENATIGQLYDPAMAITDQAEADQYFADLVEHCQLRSGKSREEAERIQRINLGYYAGYSDHETRERVERLFRCAHPIFGAIAVNGPPDPKDALIAGMQLGARIAHEPHDPEKRSP